MSGVVVERRRRASASSFASTSDLLNHSIDRQLRLSLGGIEMRVPSALLLLVVGGWLSITTAMSEQRVDDIFLMPQDFGLADTQEVSTPSPAQLDALENADLFEGDIMGLPPLNDDLSWSSRQLRDDATPLDDDERRIFGLPQHSSLNTDTYADKLWANARIPYQLEEGMTPSQRAAIAQAFMEYRDKTCIKFVPRDTNDYDYIYIKRNLASGCSSYVGRAGGNQTVSLEVVKCFSKGIIAHELMHAIGFFHEHSRTDRDEYVLIDEKNIRPNMHRNFERYPIKVIDTLGMPYDYESIMHYHKLAFSRNGRPTIMPRNDSAEIGQRYKLSRVDVLKINKLYKCDGSSSSSGESKSTSSRKPSSLTVTSPTPSTSSPSAPPSRVRTVAPSSIVTSRVSTIVSTTTPTSAEWRRRTFAPWSRVTTDMPTATPSSATPRATSDRWKLLTERPFGERRGGWATASPPVEPRSSTSRSTRRPSSGRSSERWSSLSSSSAESSTRTKSPQLERSCRDLNAHCEMWSRLGHCNHSLKYMSHYCRRSCGLCPTSSDGKREFRSRATSSRPLIRVGSGGGSETTSGVCVDKNLFCSYWTSIGECSSQSKFMKLFCRRSCKLC